MGGQTKTLHTYSFFVHVQGSKILENLKYGLFDKNPKNPDDSEKPKD